MAQLPRGANGRSHGRTNGRRPALRSVETSIGGLRVASELLARAQIASLAGLSFGTKRDLYEALGYDRLLDPQKIRARYDRGGIAATVVDAICTATWRGGARVYEDEDEAVETPFEQAFEALATRLRLWPTFKQADILAGFGEYAVVLIGASGDIATELPRMKRQEDVAYLAPYGQEDVEIAALVTEPADPRFGRPLAYRFLRLTPSLGARTQKQIAKTVHWTRVVHVADMVLDDPVRGASRMARVWNRLDDLDKITGGGAEAHWLRAHQGYGVELDKDLELDDAELKRIQDHVEAFAHQMRRTMALRGAEVKALGSDVALIDKNADAVLTQIAGTTRIPKRILVGSEQGELASTQDQSNWNERVADRRTDWAGPLVVRQLLDRLIEYGALPRPAQYEVEWPELANLNDTEKAGIADTYANVNQKTGEEVFSADEIRHVVGLSDRAEAGLLDPLSQPAAGPGVPAAARGKARAATAPSTARRTGIAPVSRGPWSGASEGQR